MAEKNAQVVLDKVVVRFAGDSGDGMQYTGSQFTFASALAGNDLATFPDFPAEIRAPKGTVEGVSGFQVQIGKVDIFTAGDVADVLVAMNPAALKSNLKWVREGGNIILDSDAFTSRAAKKAGYEGDPLADEALQAFHLIQAPISSLTKKALEESGLDNKTIMRSKNMFALGISFWLFDRKMDQTLAQIDAKFGQKAPEVAEANKKVLYAGYHYAETVEALPSNFKVPPAKLAPGTYRHISGNIATAWGLMAAREKLGLKLFYGSYPITPASDILHELSKYKHMDVITLQAEDEIAAVSSAIGACYAGHIGVTASAGPGIALKGEAIGLAVMAELPLVVVDVQRGGPSTGLPTKTEQADLFMAIYGRNSDCPAIVVAPGTPSQCFDMAFAAAKLAIEHMTPVIFLSDGNLANGSEPWKLPNMADLPAIEIAQPPESEGPFHPYLRDEDKLSRYWVTPGTPGKEHRIGGLEKEALTGNVSYDPRNHQAMIYTRAEKVARVAHYIPKQSVVGHTFGELLVIGWGSTYGTLLTAVKELWEDGYAVSLAHINYINPFPSNIKELLGSFEKRLVCELNIGQMVHHLRATMPEFDYISYNKIQGLPFTVSEIKARILEEL